MKPQEIDLGTSSFFLNHDGGEGCPPVADEADIAAWSSIIHSIGIIEEGREGGTIQDIHPFAFWPERVKVSLLPTGHGINYAKLFAGLMDKSTALLKLSRAWSHYKLPGADAVT